MSNSNELKIEHYILGNTIGIGAFGKVKIARHEFTTNNVAVKIVNKKRMRDKNMGSRIKREIKLLRYFNHPNIIRLYEVLETQTDVFLIMEHAPRGELFELIARKGKLSELEAKFFFRQIVAGVEYCHSNLVAHRDLKPENILIDEYSVVKIADFGLSNLMKDGKFMKTDCGSPNYAAPEVISKRKYCGTEADTWSCGVILFALLAGYLPFDEEVLHLLFKKIKDADYEMPEHFSPEAKDLIRRMLQPNPIYRMKFHEIKSHPWLRSTYMLYLDPRQIRYYLNPAKVDVELFDRLKAMTFNFMGLTDEKVKESIKKRKDYSFVIAYNLMFDEAIKKQVMAKILNKQQESLMLQTKSPKALTQTSFLHNESTAVTISNEGHDESGLHVLESVKETILDKFTPVKEKTLKTLVGDYDGWHYGLRYEYPPHILMACVVETLLELNTTYIKKSSSYKISCFHHIYKKDFPMLPLEPHIPTKPGAGPMVDKFAKDELAFNVRIFLMEKGSKEYIIDIQRTRGHSIMFLDYCQKFVQAIHKNLLKEVESRIDEY